MQFQKDSNNNRIRQRRIYYQDNTPESEPGELIYRDPIGNQVFSPNQSSPEQNYDFTAEEPNSIQIQTKSMYQKIPKEFKENSEKIYNQNFNPKYQRSPHILNIGSSREDNDYNILPSINSKKSPNNNIRYNNFNRDSNDDYFQSPYEDDDYQPYPRESQRTGMFYRERSPVINLNKKNKKNKNKNISPYGRPGVIPINKMSPEQNYEESNDSGEKHSKEKTAQFNNLKNYLGRNNLYQNDINDININNLNPNQTLQNPQMINPSQDDINDKYNNRSYNNMSYRDIKRIANRFTKVYDPNKNNNGLLVEEMQITVPGAQDDIFNNRYRVLSKMNRLSNILLAKQRKKNSPNKSYINRPFENRSYNKYNRDRSFNGKIKKPFDPRTFVRSPGDINNNIRRAFSRSPEHKFLYVSLAMISSKGPSCEDRPILRRMRLDKGGVVDLAQEERKKNKFKIKNTQRKKGFKRNHFMNPKYREKAAKIIQSWWKELKNIYNYRMKQIIKIQSAFRGKFVRKYMYDLFYLNFLYISFCKKIENVLRNHVKPYVFRKLMGKNVEDTVPKEESPVPDKETLLGRILSRDYRNDLNTIYPSWKKWMANTRRINAKNMKGRNLVQIRADKEKKKGDIRNALNKWYYICKILKAQDKLNEDNKRTIIIESKKEIKTEISEKEIEKEKENNLKKIK